MTKQLSILISTLFILNLITTPLLAQGNSTNTKPNSTNPGQAKKETQTTTSIDETDEDTKTPNIQPRGNAPQNQRQQLLLDLKETKEASREAMFQARLDLKAEIEANREQFKTQIQTKLKTFQTKLNQIQDEAKQQRAQLVHTRITQINQHRTDHYANIIEKLYTIFDRLQAIVDAAQTNGADTSTAQIALDDAYILIQEAETALTDQASKDYTATITTEDDLQENMDTSYQDFKADIKAIHTMLVQARQQLAQAARAIAPLRSIANTGTPTATDSADLTPSPSSTPSATPTATSSAQLSPSPTIEPTLTPTATGSADSNLTPTP